MRAAYGHTSTQYHRLHPSARGSNGAPPQPAPQPNPQPAPQPAPQ